MDSATEIVLGDKCFRPLIPNAQILERIQQLALEINEHYGDRKTELLAILDGAGPFAGALQPLFLFENRIHQLRLKSYRGMNSSQQMNWSDFDFGVLAGKHVLILEDIMDSGYTMHMLIQNLNKMDVKSLQSACLLFKPVQLKYPVKPDFTGFQIGTEFVVGFGMDYNEQGRELTDIYHCINP